MQKFIVAVTLFVANESQVRVALFTVFTNSTWIIILQSNKISNSIVMLRSSRTHLVFFQEWFGIVVCIDINFGERIVDFWIRASVGNSHVKPRKQELQTVSLLNFLAKLADVQLALDRHEQALDDVLVTVNIKQSTNNFGCASWIDSLHVDFDKLLKIVLIKVEDEVMDKAETVTNDNEWKLVAKSCFLYVIWNEYPCIYDEFQSHSLFCYLQESLDLFRIVVVAFTANTLYLADVSSTASSLYVFEVHKRILADVHDRAQVIIQSFYHYISNAIHR